MNALHDQHAASGDIDQSKLQQLLGWQVSRAELHLSRKIIESLAPLSLRPIDFFILVLIGSNHGIHQRQIGDTLGISPPNLVSVITRLIKKHLIRRARGRQDRRIQHLYLTAPGSERLAEAEAVVVQIEAELTALISPRKRAIVESALQHIIAY